MHTRDISACVVAASQHDTTVARQKKKRKKLAVDGKTKYVPLLPDMEKNWETNRGCNAFAAQVNLTVDKRDAYVCDTYLHDMENTTLPTYYEGTHGFRIALKAGVCTCIARNHT